MQLDVSWSMLGVKQKAHLFELSCLMSEGKFDVVAITETWANDTVTDAMLTTNPINGQRHPYLVFRHDRNDVLHKEGGGVCFLVRDSYSVFRYSVVLNEEFSFLEAVCNDLSVGATKHRLICVYRQSWQGMDGAKFIVQSCDVPFPITVVGDFEVPWSASTPRGSQRDRYSFPGELRYLRKRKIILLEYRKKICKWT